MQQTPITMSIPTGGLGSAENSTPQTPPPVPQSTSMIDALLEPSLYETDLLEGTALITENIKQLLAMEAEMGEDWLNTRIADNLLFNVSDLVRRSNSGLFAVKRTLAPADREYVNRFRFILAGIDVRFKGTDRIAPGSIVLHNWLAPSKEGDDYPYDVNFGLRDGDANVSFTLGTEKFEAWRRKKYGH